MILKKRANTLIIILGLGFLTTACLGGQEFEYHPIDEIPKGPGLFTGSSGAASFDATTGKWSLGGREGLAGSNERTSQIIRQRSLARRRLEGATSE